MTSAWRTIASFYYKANQATHHAFGWLLVILLLFYFLFCAAFLSLRYVVLPNIDHYKPDIEQMATKIIDRPVTIGRLSASWRGLRPNLSLQDVVIHDQQGGEALVLPQVAATFSWLSALVAEARLHSLEVSRPDLEIERDKDGRLIVAGIKLEPDQQDDGRGLDWLLSQREIVIRDGSVTWRDDQRAAPELRLEHVDFLLQNLWQNHRVALKATPPSSLAAPIDLRAEFKHPPFASAPSDYSQWAGEIYADWRNTNLEAWRQYIDTPPEVSGGAGAVRAWLKFDRGVVSNFTADLALSDLTVQLNNSLSPLKLLEASGRISAGEVSAGLKQKLFSFGSHGHALTLTDFSLRTGDGEVLPPTTASNIFTAASKGKPERHEIKITSLDLNVLARLARHLPLSAEQKQMLGEFAPRGNLRNFSASWEGSVPGSGKYRVNGQFADLSLKPQRTQAAVTNKAGKPAATAMPEMPGFEGLTGNINASEEGGSINLGGKNITLYLPGYFPDPVLPFEVLDLRAGWSLREYGKLSLKINSMQFTQAGVKGSLEGKHELPLPAHGGNLGNLDMALHIPSVDLTKIARYLPSLAPDSTRDWIAKALKGGTGKDVHVVIKGDLDNFPFQPKTASEKPSGVFKVIGKIENGVLNPAPDLMAADKRTPLWPQIEEIRGNLVMDRTRIHIHADSARTRGAILKGVDAIIPDYRADNSRLELQGNASGPMQAMLAYVNNSPVLEWIDHFTEDARASGDAKLALSLQLPLSGTAEPTAKGSLRFMGNDLQLGRSLPTLQQTRGELGFTEKGFQLTGMQANLLGGSITANGGTQRDGVTQIKMDGTLTAEGLGRGFPGQTMRKLAKKMSGSTRYSALLRIKNSRPELSVESSLAGIALDLPPPLRKTAPETMPVRFTQLPLPETDSALQTEEIRITMGKTIAARYLRQRTTEKNAPWKLVRGGIGINQPAPQPDSGLAIYLNAPLFSADAWRSTVTSLLPETGTTESAVDFGAADFSSYVMPDVLGLRARKLTMAGRTFDNAVLGASRQRGIWQLNIYSDQAVGYATWNDPSSERGAGKLTARLTSLVIPQSAASEVSDLLSSKSSIQLPGLDIVADNFELMDIKLGKLELTASNAGITLGREWRINQLAISNPDASLRSSGKWSIAGGESLSSLDYELTIGDAGRTLDRFGFEKLLKGGKGKMEGSLNWKGAPYAFDIPSLSGKLSLNIATGQFLKVDPGAAKLLGVLSLQSLPRRLMLDFRDLFSDGFAFDSIASSANITRGLMKTDSFKMRGVNALVLMDGTVNLTEETQNMNVVVIPELNAGGASVVYALAVNPVIGLGTFLAQLFLRNPLSAALTQEYEITGPWKDPAVKKVASSRKVAADTPAPADTTKSD